MCLLILWSWGAENIAPAADFRLKKGLCRAVNQRDDGELHERGAASTEFGEILIYPFARRTVEEKIRIKELGPDKPDFMINQQTKEKNSQ